MDNPFSWFVLVIIVVIWLYFSAKKAAAEQERYRSENEIFFRTHNHRWE